MSSKRPSAKQKRLVEARARWRCEYCLSPAACSPQTFNVDHVVSVKCGGKTAPDNLALACGCNGYKGHRIRARDPQTKRLVAIFNPRRQKWSDHFAWSDDSLQIIGLTATGRATVAALRLNRPELVKLRRLLLAGGEHPPKISESAN